MRDITFGQYYPSNSIIHKLDARIKFILSMFYMVTIFFIKSYVMYLLMSLFVMVIVFIIKVPIKSIMKNFKPLIFIILFFSIFNIFFYKGNSHIIFRRDNFLISLDGIDNAIKISLRLFLLIFGTILLTVTTTPTEMTDAIESLLSPLKLIKVPVHDFAIIISLALRFIPNFIEDIDKIIMAQKSRGADFDSKNIVKKVKAYIPVLIPLFVSAFQKADQLAEALDSRCYNATKNRTRYKKAEIRLRDVISVLIFLMIATMIILDAYYLKLSVLTEDRLTQLIMNSVGVI